MLRADGVGQQAVQGLAQQFSAGIARQRLHGAIDIADAALLVDDDDGVEGIFQQTEKK